MKSHNESRVINENDSWSLIGKVSDTHKESIPNFLETPGQSQPILNHLFRTDTGNLNNNIILNFNISRDEERSF